MEQRDVTIFNLNLPDEIKKRIEFIRINTKLYIGKNLDYIEKFVVATEIEGYTSQLFSAILTPCFIFLPILCYKRIYEFIK